MAGAVFVRGLRAGLPRSPAAALAGARAPARVRDAMYLGVVLNPLARKNRNVPPEAYARIERLVAPFGEVVRTDSLAALRPAVERMLPKVTHFVSDGGDGALHWLINEVREVAGEASASTWPAFIPTNGGTIDFVAHKAEVHGRTEAIVRGLVAAAEEGAKVPEVALDSLHLTGEHDDGAPFDRIGFALAAGGVGQRFFDKYYQDPEPSPRTIVRVISRTVADLVRDRLGRRREASYAAHLFRPTYAKVVIDGEELPQRRHAGLHAGAFDVNLGGVVRVFPQAARRGVLHFQAGEISPARMVLSLPAIVRGGAIRAPSLRDTAGQHMRIETEPGERLDPVIDGERFERLRRLDVRLGPEIRIARLPAR